MLRKRMRNFIYALMLIVLSLGGSLKAENLVKYVNTLQGTDSNFGLSWGNTYPTTALPYPMHGWSAQTGKNGDGWKYQYSAQTIRGFQQTHQCSPWVGDYGVFSLMPVSGDLKVNEDQRASSFNHKNEIAKPHYYRVKFDNGMIAEMSPTTRCAHMRFSFPRSKQAFIVLDGYIKLNSVHIDPERHRITGYVHNGNWIPDTFKSYFIIQFNKPFLSYGTWENKKNTIQEGQCLAEGEGVGAYIEFSKGAEVEIKVTSSYISPEQAEVTLEKELGKFSTFEQTKQMAFDEWNNLLNRVFVEGGSKEQKATFYSCMFRANLFSHKFYEEKSDGSPYYYSPYDGKIHDGYMYTDNGFWDTFRSQFPLTNILHPTMQGRYMNALLDAQEQCGWLPSWSFPSETGGMLGNHAVSLLADAWAKGIRTFSPERALEAYVHEAMNKGPWGGANGRQGWKEYYQLGYVSYPESMGATSQTLEYAYDDFCGYQLAKAAGNTFYEQIFRRNMFNYKNVYDPSVGFMRGRKINGEWSRFDPYEWGGPYCEGNAWHYSWSVFHDVQGLINLMGGEEKFVAKIDSVFSVPNIVKYGTYGGKIHEMLEMELAGMGQYAHGNQPIQHMIYLYSYAGTPWKTQYWIRQVMNRLYNSSEKGYPGDEDQGGMSSWYVLSALGIYSVCPGTDQYVLGSPLFDKVTIVLENGNKFVIEARNNSDKNLYIKSATLNGVPYTKNYITYSDIIKGGILSFDMDAVPNKERGVNKNDRPFSVSSDNE